MIAKRKQPSTPQRSVSVSRLFIELPFTCDQTHLQLVDIKQNRFGGGIFPFKGEAGTAAKNLLIRIIFLAVVNDML